ncbi:PhzF family phenazine biosynthesis protein [Oscillatoria sp. CS-180]|uniref:PhzF family phenazine biosynthesis protein n=1 Tax=Oscillatoria sp. CS-180 TaxID=3021720 RepID=UPI00232C9F8A|nr:PhzF family phenazine biosynthesis protein [Oscillatoria sp. CS-180]MDB9529528.1 PhzF family phenazine biosynthesis protein [Oscillatoria sp. CS-180]
MDSATSVEILQVDAFTEKAFAGNPAAVCVLPQAADETWMRSVAAEMNLSETAFLHPVEDGYQLRWFTPAAEVDLCGHATLASAHVLWSEGHLSTVEEARFHTRSGLLTATQSGDWITLNFPTQPVKATTASPELLRSLRGLMPDYVGFGGSAESNFLVELPSEDHVRSLQPDFSIMTLLPVQGVIVTAPGEEDTIDFVSRYFAPAVGINEDPVTGSAHCSLAPYWQEKLGQSEFLARQVSARGGVLKVQVQGDRVLISGQAITVLKGRLLSTPVFAA